MDAEVSFRPMKLSTAKRQTSPSQHSADTCSKVVQQRLIGWIYTGRSDFHAFGGADQQLPVR
ncbi:hypothetical protein SynBIOSE41_02114 [Synechococcus sp. BIOS-E4-1]|nr:hypothetical protein SynBIOSE41_02114 [Synechococcus sp. BIOS-E4-1]